MGYRVQLIFLKCCPENVSFRKLMLGEKRQKNIAQQILQAHRTMYFLQLLKTNLLSKISVS